MESPETSQQPKPPSQPQPESNSLSPNHNCDACTPRTPQYPLHKQARAKWAKIQAFGIQKTIAQTIEANGVSPATLASLSRVWLDLEFYRSGLAGPAVVAMPAANRKKPIPQPTSPEQAKSIQQPGPEFTEEP